MNFLNFVFSSKPTRKFHRHSIELISFSSTKNDRTNTRGIKKRSKFLTNPPGKRKITTTAIEKRTVIN